MQVVIELPYLFVQTIIYGVIVYAMIGFEWTVTKFLWYLFFMYFTLLYFTLYGMMTVAVTPNHNIAGIVSSAFYAIWNLFSGFIIPKTVNYPKSMIISIGCLVVGINFTDVFQFAENPGVVEMVLLHLSNFLDIVWISCFTVWRR